MLNRGQVLPIVVLPIVQKQRDFGLYVPSTPILPVTDVAGRVQEVGSGVTKFKKGDLVFGQGSMMGGNDARASQEFVILEDWATSSVPAGLSADDATTVTSNLTPGVIALFSPAGFNWPKPGSPESKAFDYGAQSLVIAGANSDNGRLTIQLAKLAGIGKIIAIASSSSAANLKSLGATHVIDRRLPVEEIKKQAQISAGSTTISKVFNTVDSNIEMALAVLSESEKGIIATIVPADLRGQDDSWQPSRSPC